MLELYTLALLPVHHAKQRQLLTRCSLIDARFFLLLRVAGSANGRLATAAVRPKATDWSDRSIESDRLIGLSFVRRALVDGMAFDRGDLVGSAVVLVGVCVILWRPGDDDGDADPEGKTPSI